MSLTFELPSVWLAGLPVVAALLAWYASSARKRSSSRWRLATLVALRGAVLLILLSLAARPIYVAPQLPRSQRNQVLLLVDRSRSMSVVDHGQTRYYQAVALMRDRLLPALQRAELVVKAFLFAEDATAADGRQIAAATADGRRTNLGRAIARALGQGPSPPLALLALTDGAATDQTDNARALTALVENRVPFVGIGLGDETDFRILSLHELAVPTLVPPNHQFQVSAHLRATGEGQLPSFALVLLRDGQLIQQKRIAQNRGARDWVENFPVSEPGEGMHSYTVRLLPPDDPTLKLSQTEATATVRVASEKELRVLFVQGDLTWDYKFIRLALLEDATIRFSGLSRTANTSRFFEGMDNAAELAGGFPGTLEGLAAFQTIVLSNLRPDDLTPTQQDLLARFCRELGGGVLMIGGPATFHAVWRGTPLEDLLPVRFRAFSGDTAPGVPFHLQLTDAALEHPVFAISQRGEHRAAWSRLPAFTSYARVDEVKPGAQIWAMHPFDTGPGGRAVLMAAQRYGAGLSAVISVQNFWRWRLAKGSDTREFDRFWQQLLRYLAEGGRQIITILLADQPLQPGSDVRLSLEWRPTGTISTSTAQPFRMQVHDENKTVVSEQRIELRPRQPEDVSFRPAQAGVFAISVADPQGHIHAMRSVDIRDVDIEFVRAARNMENLRQWARISGGFAIRAEDCDDAGQLIQRLETHTRPRDTPPPLPTPLGVSRWMLGLLLGCLCTEWALRKRYNMM